MKDRVDLALSLPDWTTEELLELVVYRLQTFEGVDIIRDDVPARVYMSDARSFAQDALSALKSAWKNANAYHATTPPPPPVPVKNYDGPVLT